MVKKQEKYLEQMYEIDPSWAIEAVRVYGLNKTRFAEEIHANPELEVRALNLCFKIGLLFGLAAENVQDQAYFEMIERILPENEHRHELIDRFATDLARHLWRHLMMDTSVVLRPALRMRKHRVLRRLEMAPPNVQKELECCADYAV